MKALAGIVLMVGLFVQASPVLACSCTAAPAPKQALKKSAAVFSGKVMKVEPPRVSIVKRGRSLKATSGQLNEVTLEVERVWKGVDSKSITIFTVSYSSACGYAFKEGESYLVYADKKGKRLHTHSCARTKEMTRAQEDLAELGEGKPAPEAPATRPGETSIENG